MGVMEGPMMLRPFLLASFLALTAPVGAADIQASASMDLGGFFGRIDIGGAPPPVLVYPQPVVVERVAPVSIRQPIYLRVPPGHAKNWRKHCRKYQACGQPVYFVQETWYHDVYVPTRVIHEPHPHVRRVHAPHGPAPHVQAPRYYAPPAPAPHVHAPRVHAPPVHAPRVHVPHAHAGGPGFDRSGEGGGPGRGRGRGHDRDR
jgi:hypothetical protein